MTGNTWSQPTIPSSKSVADKIQAIANRYAHLYGCEAGKVSVQESKTEENQTRNTIDGRKMIIHAGQQRKPGEPIVFHIDYTKESQAAKDLYLALFSIAFPNVQKEESKGYLTRITYTCPALTPLKTVTDSLEFKLREVGKKERSVAQEKLSSLLKCSLLLADPALLMPNAENSSKDWGAVHDRGSVQNHSTGIFAIHFPDGINKSVRKKAMDYMCAALEENEAGRIAFPSQGMIEFSMVKPAHITLQRLDHSIADMEDRIPNAGPLWQQKVQVTKNDALTNDYLRELFPESSIVMSPPQKLAEIHIQSNMANYERGMDRLIKLLPNSQETTLHEKNGGIDITIHLSPTELMLRVIGSKEETDQKFISRRNFSIGK